MYFPPRNDREFSQKRLDEILSRERLTFNPYKVSDRRLLEIAETMDCGDQLDITQIVIVHFTRLRETMDYRKYDGILMRVGNRPEEVFVPTGALLWGVTANDTIRRERSWLGKRPIRNIKDIEALIGKTVFVSRIIRGVNSFGSFKSAYRMHRLKGDIHKDATIIREAMCSAKIEMLERIIAYPQSPDYLSCSKGLIDYEPRIRRAINIIRHYPDTPVPQD